MEYRIIQTRRPPDLAAEATEEPWSRADPAEIAAFHPAGSDHRPRTEARLLYDTTNLYLNFTVTDRYVKCMHTEYQSQVCEDSCVEFFVRPRVNAGYFNFEMNCGGAILCYYITDPRRDADGLAAYTELRIEELASIRVFHSLDPPIEDEIDQQLSWRIACAIPFTVFKPYLGLLAPKRGTVWQGNFYKCGDETSHPHWAAWSPIGEELNFHQPDYFGTLRFN